MSETKFDFHTHHERCGHARGAIRDYIKAAITHGIDMIGIFSQVESFPIGVAAITDSVLRSVLCHFMFTEIEE